jgi:alkylation response protein AidB-like acyl-CoA dehydrogenase
VDYGHDWAVKIVSTKHVATQQAWQVVDTAFELTGGSGIYKRSRMEQIFRDARLGRIHPANSLLTHEVVAKLSLGINPDEQPRWG